MFTEGFERAARELVGTLDRLITVGGRAGGDELARPRWLPQFPPQHLDEVGLHQNDRREIVVGSELELRVIAAGVAVMTAVRAAAIWVQSPRKGHALDAVERRAALDFLITGR